MGARHATRVLALQVLYALDMNPEAAPADVMASAWGEAEGADLDRLFLETLVAGVAAAREELDRRIEQTSHRWRVRRMDRVDRGILRLAAYELFHDHDTPGPVILDESVRLAKEFGTPESPAFVNGILDRLAREARPAEFGGRET